LAQLGHCSSSNSSSTSVATAIVVAKWLDAEFG
jgi:hypothetical protein